MKKASVFLADGFEDVEGLAVIDILRRAGVSVTTVSIKEEKEIVSSHGIPMKTDTLYKHMDFSQMDMLVLPGGGKGSENLENYQPLRELVTEFAAQGKKVAAICAAPRILAGLGLLKGKKATCYPSVAEMLEGAQLTENPVEVDGNITTSRGMGTAIDFGLELTAQLCGEEAAEKVRKSIVYRCS